MEFNFALANLNTHIRRPVFQSIKKIRYLFRSSSPCQGVDVVRSADRRSRAARAVAISLETVTKREFLGQSHHRYDYDLAAKITLQRLMPPWHRTVGHRAYSSCFYTTLPLAHWTMRTTWPVMRTSSAPTPLSFTCRFGTQYNCELLSCGGNLSASTVVGLQA